jgi:hypothetical protein
LQGQLTLLDVIQPTRKHTMCFSATASFTLSTILVSTGIFSVITAYKFNKKYLLLALMPIIFGLQQGLEGMIWLNMNAENVLNLPFYMYSYLFFAFYFWPAYIPVSIYFTENNGLRKKMMLGCMVAGQILGIIIFTPVLIGVIPVSINVIKHSIHYGTYQSSLVLWGFSIAYISIITLPLFLSSAPAIVFFGWMVLVSSLLSYWLYFYVFTSTWCFFAAIFSLYIAHILKKEQKKWY